MKKILSYFHDCFYEDRTTTFIRDIFGQDVEYLHFLNDEEQLFTGSCDHVYLPEAFAEKLKKQAYTYRKEKEILYSSLFLTGVLYNDSNERLTICAPLLFHKAAVVQKNDYSALELQPDHIRFNYRLINTIKNNPEALSNLYDNVEDMLSDTILDPGELQQLSRLLGLQIEKLDSTQTINYPELVTEAELKKITSSLSRKRTTTLSLVPASCIGLFKKGKETQGILNELKEMIDSERFSTPLQELFTDVSLKITPPKSTALIPAILSTAQQNIVKQSYNHKNNIVIGPPGTGKSYTIATLAMSYLSQGKTVLISSSRDQAVDVIADKIEEQLNLKKCIIRGGSKSYLKDLKKFIQDLLNGLYSTNNSDIITEKKLSKTVKETRAKRAHLEKVLIKAGSYHTKKGQYLAQEAPSLKEKLYNAITEVCNTATKPLWIYQNNYNKTLNQFTQQSRELLALRHQISITKSLKKDRNSLNSFLKALRARTGGKKEELFKNADFEKILQFFPIWLVKLSDINRVLPHEIEMFDIAIIDEATQCDIASCLPIIQRAKSVIIAGDPNQLRHISFLSTAKMSEIAEKYEIDDPESINFRKKSILDYYSETLEDQNSVHFLDEHYRSLPEIINFSNKFFYDSRLHIMTEKAIAPKDVPLEFHHCNGERSKQGINVVEIENITACIKKIICDDHQQHPQSIGILSPFRNQVDALSKKLSKEIDIETQQRHKLLIGTAHAFQGEERDVMLLSFTIDNNSHGNITRFLEKADIFNVSITRAKTKQHIFYSCSPESLKPTSLIRQYLSSNQSQRSTRDKNSTSDAFAENVKKELEPLGFTVYTAYPLAGIMMDIVIVKEGHTIGIDLIGYPGEFEDVYSLDRYRMFRRANLTIFPLPYAEWVNDKQQCINAVYSVFHQEHNSN